MEAFYHCNGNWGNYTWRKEVPRTGKGWGGRTLLFFFLGKMDRGEESRIHVRSEFSYLMKNRSTLLTPNVTRPAKNGPKGGRAEKDSAGQKKGET